MYKDIVLLLQCLRAFFVLFEYERNERLFSLDKNRMIIQLSQDIDLETQSMQIRSHLSELTLLWTKTWVMTQLS